MRKLATIVLAMIISASLVGCGKAVVSFPSTAMTQFKELEGQEVWYNYDNLKLEEFEKNADLYDQEMQILEDIRHGEINVFADELLYMEDHLKFGRPVQTIRLSDIWSDEFKNYGVYGYNRDGKFEALFWGRKYARGIFEFDKCQTVLLEVNNMVQIQSEHWRIVRYEVADKEKDAYVISQAQEEKPILLRITAE